MASPQSAGGMGRVVLIAVVAVVAVGLFVVGFAIRPALVPSPSVASQIEAELQPIQSEMDALKERIEELQSAIDEQRAMLQKQQETLAGLESSRSENMGRLTEQVNALSTRLDELTSTVEDLPARPQADDESESQASGANGEPEADPASVGPDDDPAIGAEDAPVTIIAFSDFQCPYCRQFEQGAFQQLKSEYIETGQVRLVFRDFPLTEIHPNALSAAMAAECAHDQDAFWPMHDRLFANQSAWGDSSNPNETFSNYAEEIGLDVDAFRQCLESQEPLPEIRNDFQAGVDGGVRGTPAFFLGEEMLSGAQPFSAFQQRIERLLNDDGNAQAE